MNQYVVTESRANIGTSNMTGDYFHGTAGTSLNLTHPSLVAGLQARFERDSEYAVRNPTP